MNWKTALLVALALGIASSAFGISFFSDVGTWPKTWPQELDPLRKQASSSINGIISAESHYIPFTKREEFEAAWPHLLKVKSTAAPIVLVRSPLKHWHYGKVPAGIFIHSPPGQSAKGEIPQAAPLAAAVTHLRERWLNTNYIELVVDGEIVDLNRLALPAHTPIIDQRFEEEQK